MAQLSRPFQIALGAVLLLGLVWVVALHAHNSNPSQPLSATPPAPTQGTVAKTPAKGATRVARAHKPAADPRASARKATGGASAPAHNAHTHTTAVVVRTPTSHTHKATAHTHVHPIPLASAHAGPSTSKQSKRAPQQVAVEHELAQGKTVMLVFWNPKSSVDREVQAQARALADASKGTVTIHSALATQVDRFGSITEVAQVDQTPTILIVNRHGVVSTLTGLTEVFALQQAVRDAQRAAK